MRIIVVKPWQARLVLGLAFALFVAGGYHLSQRSIVPVTGEVPGLGKPLFEVAGVNGLVTLAVNVDWGSEEIPPMLEVLKRHNAKVTFFVTGKWAEQNKDLLRQMAAAGHEIANHGYSHAHPRQLSNEALKQHILANQALLEEVVGEVAQLWAPPYGEWDRRVVEQAAKLGFRTVMWTIDTRDWQDPSAEVIVNRVVPKVTPGCIVLMHPKPNTVSALPAILDGLRAKGLLAVTLSTMLAAAPGAA